MGPAGGPAMKDSAFTKSGVPVYVWASSARTMTAAAEPSLTPEQSKMPSGPATRGEQAMTSLATSFLNWARGRTIADVCIAHGLRHRELDDPERFPDRRDVRGQPTNVRFLAIMLRLGD